MKNYEEMTIKELEKEIEEMNKAKVALNMKKSAEATKRAKKLAEEKEARYAAIYEEIKKTDKMIKDCIKDYGSFSFDGCYQDADIDAFNLLRRFFF